MPFPRLIRVDLRPAGDNKTFALTPSGAIFEIDAPPAIVESVLASCDGARSLEAVLAGCTAPSGFVEVIQILREHGAVTDDDRIIGEEHWTRFPGVKARPGALAEVDLLLVGNEELGALMVERGLLPNVRSVQVTAVSDRALDNLAGGMVLIVMSDHFDPGLLVRVNDACHSVDVRWTQFHVDGGRCWLGPGVIPGKTADYRDLLIRRRCTSGSDEIFSALSQAPSSPIYHLPSSELLWALSSLAVQLERWLIGVPTALLGNEIELDPVAMTTTVHPILAVIERPPHPRFQNDVVGGTDLLRDERTGIITTLTQVTHHRAVPKSLTTVIARVADTTRVAPWATNTVCGGSVLGAAREVVEITAIGESVERYCSNWIRPELLIRASQRELTARGERCLDPAEMVLYSEKQYETPGFPFVRFSPDLRVQWIRGRSLTSAETTSIPASFAYVNWYAGPYAEEPPTNFGFYSGVAAGPSLDEALCYGLEELIERDATMIWWANRPLLPTIQPNATLDAPWLGDPQELGQRAWVIALDNEFRVPVIAGVVEDTHEHLLTMGFAARPDPTTAALKAWSEALTAQENSRDLLTEHGQFREAVRLRQKSGEFIHPWREDRKYLDSFREDFRDVGDLECQPQVYLDPRAIERIRPWISGPVRRNLTSVPQLPERSLSTYRALVEQAGYEILYVDLTTPDIVPSGLVVVRVIVPGLVPNFPAAFPFLGRRRLQDAAVELGWRSTPLTEGELTTMPLPHA